LAGLTPADLKPKASPLPLLTSLSWNEPTKLEAMRNRRITVIIVLLIGAAIVFLIIRKNGPETARETTPAGNEKDQNQSSALLPDASADSPTSNAHSEPQVSKAFPKLVAIEGKGIVLKVFNDGNFQLSLSASAGDILVSVGEDFFQTSVADIPTGVRIKIRNGNGEILTTTDVSGLDGWYTPAVYSSNSYAVLPNQERELLRTDQRSAVFKLSGMILILPRNLKNQDDLEFKLSVHSYLHSSAREANGDPLNPETFPEFETDWLDGSLLFVGE
jgi:hypothetical protein